MSDRIKNLLDIDDQIERNEKYLEFYYGNYQKTQAKITVLTLIYSVISIYTVQIIKYPFENTDLNSTLIVFIVFLLAFLSSLICSVFNTYKLLHPEEVAYMNFPKFFYNNIKEQYEERLETNDESTLNEYVKATYLNELETAIETNSNLFNTKSRFYYLSFRFGLAALILYLICAGFVVFKDQKENVSKVNIVNFKEIVEFSDSLSLNNKYFILMSDSNKESKNKKRPKIDSSKVIISKPKMIRENFLKTSEKRKTKDSLTSSED